MEDQLNYEDLKVMCAKHEERRLLYNKKIAEYRCKNKEKFLVLWKTQNDQRKHARKAKCLGSVVDCDVLDQ